MTHTADQAEGLRRMMGSNIGEFPNVPKMIAEAQSKATTLNRLETLSEFIEFYKTTSTIERKHLVVAMMDYDETGDVTGLEDYACALTASQKSSEPYICSQCNGSGEGRGDGAVCTECRSSGGVK